MNDIRLIRHPLGFWQVRDMPQADALRLYYEEQYYQEKQGNYREQYSQAERDWISKKLDQKMEVVCSLRGKTKGRFFDVGCGEGFAMDHFHRLGWAVRGIDHSDEGLLRMNPHMKAQMVMGDLWDLLDREVESGIRHDVIWLSNVLEHVPDPVALLQSLQRLASRTGVLMVTVPNDASAYQEDLLQNGLIPDRFWIAIPDHLAYFDMHSLVATTEHCGWSCDRVLADFPIDWYLSHPGSNYIDDPHQGQRAHQARIRLEMLMGDHPHSMVNSFYESLAQVGMGRQLSAFLLPSTS